MTTLVVHPARQPLYGSVPLAGDGAIAQRALVLAGLARGPTTLQNAAETPPVAKTRDALRALGVVVEHPSSGAMIVHGVGFDGLRAPANAIDAGSSGATVTLLVSLVAAQGFTSTLVTDGSLQAQSFARVVAPLRSRGAQIRGRERVTASGEVFPPLVVGPLPDGRSLGGIEHDSPTADEPVKTALLVSGLFAEGPTRFREPSVSRDDTERLLVALNAPIRTVGPAVELDPTGWDRRLEPFELRVPGDFSAAAFLLLAGLLVDRSRVTVRDVGINPTRAGLLAIAKAMGAGLAVVPLGDRLGSPLAELSAARSAWHGASIGDEPLVRAMDDLPAVCVLAARAHGTSRIAFPLDLAPSHVDRLAVMFRVLCAFGVSAAQQARTLEIEGCAGPLAAADFDTAGDGAVAMAACVLALVGRGPSRIRGAEGIAVAYPRFVATLRALGARIDVEA